MTRKPILTGMSANKFASARFKEAQKRVAAGTLYALKTATTPIQMLAKQANKVAKLENLTGVNKKKSRK